MSNLSREVRQVWVARLPDGTRRRYLHRGWAVRRIYATGETVRDSGEVAYLVDRSAVTQGSLFEVPDDA